MSCSEPSLQVLELGWLDERSHVTGCHIGLCRPEAESISWSIHGPIINEACYTCHTNYAMFGGIKAKLGGLRHIYVYYLGTPPAPENIKLYEPFNNRECLHCHAGARSFEEGAAHTADPDLLPAVKANKRSCISSGCHEVVHDVGRLKGVKFWKGGD